MKKGLIAVFVLCGICTGVQAQSIDRFKEQLQRPDSAYQSRVMVAEHGTAASAVRSMAVHPSGAKVQGFRVCIYSDNVQNARTLARDAEARFKEIYPDIPTYMSYVNPYFRVTVGDCLTKEEAIILWGKIKGAFDRAVISQREEIPLAVLGERQTASEASNQ